MSSKQYFYSTDGETYNSPPFDSEEEAFMECIFHEDGDCDVYVGEGKPPRKFSELMDLEYTLQRMSEDAYDDCGGVVQEWPTATTGQVKDLENLIDEWATKYGQQPTFFGIGKVVEYSRIDGVVTRRDQ